MMIAFSPYSLVRWPNLCVCVYLCLLLWMRKHCKVTPNQKKHTQNHTPCIRIWHGRSNKTNQNKTIHNTLHFRFFFLFLCVLLLFPITYQLIVCEFRCKIIVIHSFFFFKKHSQIVCVLCERYRFILNALALRVRLKKLV